LWPTVRVGHSLLSGSSGRTAPLGMSNHNRDWLMPTQRRQSSYRNGSHKADILAPAISKPLVAVKNATPVPAPAAVGKKTSSKVAVKSSTEVRKTAPL
jgi:hypothetical protein